MIIPGSKETKDSVWVAILNRLNDEDTPSMEKTLLLIAANLSDDIKGFSDSLGRVADAMQQDSDSPDVSDSISNIERGLVYLADTIGQGK